VSKVGGVRRFGRLSFLVALAVLGLPAAASGQASYKVLQDNPVVGRVGAAPESYSLGLFTRTKRRQRVLRLGGVVVYVRCPGEACKVWITARVRIGRLSYPLKRVRRSLARNSRVRLRARLTRRARRVLREALHDGKRAKVDVAIRAQDRTGNSTTVRRVTVRVTH
jgi:hypothetical protein